MAILSVVLFIVLTVIVIAVVIGIKIWKTKFKARLIKEA
jgi:hypothetical protein